MNQSRIWLVNNKSKSKKLASAEPTHLYSPLKLFWHQLKEHSVGFYSIDCMLLTLSTYLSLLYYNGLSYIAQLRRLHGNCEENMYEYELYVRLNSRPHSSLRQITEMTDQHKSFKLFGR